MGKKYKDIEIGDTFGRWKVIGYSDKKTSSYGKYVFCQCGCENNTIKEITTNSLKQNKSQSCGCLQKELAKSIGDRSRKDITWQKFNHLTAIKYIGHGNDKKRSLIWKCKCDCGENVYATESSIVGGKIKSCGCHIKNDLTGKKFGRLSVLRKCIYKSKQMRKAYYICKCECGKSKLVRHDALVSGSVTSCGCLKREYEDLVGRQFGELAVVDFVERYYYENTDASVNMWKCECSCGNIITVRQGNLISGNTLSCGCTKISKGELETENILMKHKLLYMKQYRFEGCKYKYPLSFDFYLPELNACVEYDGEQHYFPVDFSSKGNEWAEDQFKENQKRDNIKNQYCSNEKIPLIRIPFWEKDNLESFLLCQLHKLGIDLKGNKTS